MSNSFKCKRKFRITRETAERLVAKRGGDDAWVRYVYQSLKARAG